MAVQLLKSYKYHLSPKLKILFLIGLFVSVLSSVLLLTSGESKLILNIQSRALYSFVLTAWLVSIYQTTLFIAYCLKPEIKNSFEDE